MGRRSGGGAFAQRDPGSAIPVSGPRAPGIESMDSVSVEEQGDWIVTISRYADGGGQPMPRILTATNPDTRVRMVIDRWSFFEN